jgi:hypothetical protein
MVAAALGAAPFGCGVDPDDRPPPLDDIGGVAPGTGIGDSEAARPPGTGGIAEPEADAGTAAFGGGGIAVDAGLENIGPGFAAQPGFPLPGAGGTVGVGGTPGTGTGGAAVDQGSGGTPATPGVGAAQGAGGNPGGGNPAGQAGQPGDGLAGFVPDIP